MTSHTHKARANTDDYLAIFLHDIPLMDVRAPVEYARGSFPMAINAPILDDQQRELIGTSYKQEGTDAAVALGYQLATDDLRAQRLATWQQFTDRHPRGFLFCFRGGQRSHITQQWLYDAGCSYPLVKGGYKALRRFLLDELERAIEEVPMLILSGRTGTGKTQLIKQLPYSIDLEGLANHRGSSFGRRCSEQPGQIDFENRLAIALLRHRHQYPGMPVLLEDESKLIGRCSLPQSMRDKMQQSSLILLEESMNERIAVGLKEYVSDNLAEFVAAYGEQDGFVQFAQGLSGSLYRIRRRLGSERYQQLTTILAAAIEQHRNTGNIDIYGQLIGELLGTYYDPMYDYQLEQKVGKIIFRGNRQTIARQYNTLLSSWGEAA